MRGLVEVIATEMLKHAEWNPRSEAELKAEHPDMVKLVASVKEFGVLQPIVVWKREEEMVVIAGNRRLEAARIAGIELINAVVYTKITEAQAREITRVENEVRLGISPIEDAKLVGSMLELGYSQKEIAAHFAVSEATICRRAKLINLAPQWLEVADKVAVDALERVAQFDKEVQSKVIKKTRLGNYDRINWGDLKWSFASSSYDLEAASFNCEECKRCMDRTGAQADLFEVEAGDLGCCMRHSCYDRKAEAAFTERLNKLIGEDTERVLLSEQKIEQWKIYNKNYDYDGLFGKKRSKKFSVAWYERGYGNNINVYWGLSLEKFKEELKKRQADKKEKLKAQAEREAKVREVENKLRELSDHLDECERQLDDSIDEDKFMEAVKKMVLKPNTPCAEMFAKMILLGSQSWEFRDECEHYLTTILSEHKALCEELEVDEQLLQDAVEAKEVYEKAVKDNKEAE